MANDHVVLMDSSDGVACTADYDTNTHSPWLSLWSYLKTDIVQNKFGGSFAQYLVRNDADTWCGPVCINGGMLDGTTGCEQGCYDVSVSLDGVPAFFTCTGRYGPNEPGFMCWPPDALAIGSEWNRWASLYLTVHPARPGMPKGVSRCVKVSGGYVPLYD